MLEEMWSFGLKGEFSPPAEGVKREQIDVV